MFAGRKLWAVIASTLLLLLLLGAFEAWRILFAPETSNILPANTAGALIYETVPLEGMRLCKAASSPRRGARLAFAT